MSADPIESKPWIRSRWFTWSWLLVLALVVLQSLNYHWRLLPTTASGYFARGRTDYIGGDYERAIENLTKSIERDSLSAEAYIWRGEAHAKLHEYDRAKPDLEKALEVAPGYAKSHAAMADYLAAVWDRDAAIKEFTVAIDYDPTYARCYLERAQLQLDTERWDDAADDLRKGTGLLVEDRQATAYLLLWIARARGGDALGATAELKVAVSKRLDVHRFWAGARFLAGETAEPAFVAEMTADKAGDEEELRAEAAFLAGEKRLAFGDRAGGLALLRDVIRSGFEESYAYDRARVELARSLVGFQPMRLDDGTLAIVSVTPGGPAAAAGIEPGWRLAAIDDQPGNREAFLELLAKAEPGVTVQVQVVAADGSRRVVPLAVALTPETSAPTR